MIKKLQVRQQELLQLKKKAEAVLNQTIADINSISGAIRENAYWISVLESEKPAEAEIPQEE